MQTAREEMLRAHSVLVYSACGEEVVTLPAGQTVQRRHLKQAQTRYARALAEMAGRKPDA